MIFGDDLNKTREMIKNKANMKTAYFWPLITNIKR